MLNRNISPHVPHNTVNFGPLTAEICRRVWGTPANFNGFRVLASVLHRRRSVEVNQTLHNVGPSPGLVHYRPCMDFGGSCPQQNFTRCKIYFASKSCVLRYWQRYCTTLEHCASAKLCGVVQGMELRNFRRGRHLYSAGRPSRWTLAHILVMAALCNRGPLYFCPVVSFFLLPSIFFFLA